MKIFLMAVLFLGSAGFAQAMDPSELPEGLTVVDAGSEGQGAGSSYFILVSEKTRKCKVEFHLDYEYGCFNDKYNICEIWKSNPVNKLRCTYKGKEKDGTFILKVK